MFLFQKYSRLFFSFSLMNPDKTESPECFGFICTGNTASFLVGAKLIFKKYIYK